MAGKSKKGRREKDPTSRYAGGNLDSDLDEERTPRGQRFSRRSATAEHDKIMRTSLMRAEEPSDLSDVETLPIGQVIQVFSLYSEVEYEGRKYLAIVRKTLSKISDTAVIVGDRVRFRRMTTGSAADGSTAARAGSGEPEAMIEQILPRASVLTRADSFKQMVQHPIVANADQMLIVVSLASPRPKWGLIDRMVLAARSGGLAPIICLNKMDLADESQGAAHLSEAREVLGYYEGMSIRVIRTSAGPGAGEGVSGIEALREILGGRVTILAGHSGVGKSSLINSLQASLNLRIGAISGYTGKGRHTTTSARRYPLEFGPEGGAVIDTPGVKLFGLWGVTSDNVIEYFPDVAENRAPAWRVESLQRILASLG